MRLETPDARRGDHQLGPPLRVQADKFPRGREARSISDTTEHPFEGLGISARVDLVRDKTFEERALSCGIRQNGVRIHLVVLRQWFIPKQTPHKQVQ
jgi:hypothetical protein